MLRRTSALLLEIFLILALLVQPALAAEKPNLTIQEAISRALLFSKNIEKIQIDMQKAEDDRISAGAMFNEQWLVTYTSDAEKGIYNKEKADFAWQSALNSNDLARDSLVLDVYNWYYNVLRAREKVAAKEAGLKAIEKKVKVNNLMFQVGLVSKTAIIGLESQLASAKAALAAAEGELDNAYTALNQLVGYASEVRPVLTDTVSFTPVTGEAKDYEMLAVSESPSVWTARQAFEFKRAMVNYDTGGFGTKISSEDVRKSELDAVSAKEAAALLARKLYSGAKSLEEAYQASNRAVSASEENLRVTKIKFAVGMAIEADVIAAEADLAAARQNSFDLMAQHAYMMLALEKPWAYLGGI